MSAPNTLKVERFWRWYIVEWTDGSGRPKTRTVWATSKQAALMSVNRSGANANTLGGSNTKGQA